MLSSIDIPLPHGTTLHCHVSGERGRPVLMFLHGFPEGAFIWDDLLPPTALQLLVENAAKHNSSSATTPVIRSRGVTPIGPMLMFCCEPNWANDFGCEP